MSKLLFGIYRLLAIVLKKVQGKITHLGKLMILMTFAAMLFGLNTDATMLYQLASAGFALLLLIFPLSFFFRTSIKVERRLPTTCIAGEKLSYRLMLHNSGKNHEKGVFYSENSGAPLPLFKEFTTIPERGEQHRNFIDRKLGYYRWLSLKILKQGADFNSFELPAMAPGQHTSIEVNFTPFRRGYIELGGYGLHRLEPFGLFKKRIVLPQEAKILVLPKLYPVQMDDFGGSRKYHQGGLASASGSGDSGEFVSLREYRAGDPVKHIDWKSTARTSTPIVRQYQDEYFSRYGIVLDSFGDEDHHQIFEEAVSVAASIIVDQDSTRNVIDLLFAGNNCVSTISMGKGMAVQHHLLELLSCITMSPDKDFSEMTRAVMKHTPVLSGLIIVLLQLDNRRVELLEFLQSINLAHKVVLVVDGEEHDYGDLQEIHTYQITLLDIHRETPVVDL